MKTHTLAFTAQEDAADLLAIEFAPSFGGMRVTSVYPSNSSLAATDKPTTLVMSEARSLWRQLVASGEFVHTATEESK